MADEQFPWLDWPHSYAPPNLNQNTPRVDDTSNSNWRSPFYNSSSNSNVLNTTAANTNTNNTQYQYYPSDKQQEESYERLEDVLPYPSYRWGPPPTREYQRQTSYSDSTTSGLPLSAPSIPQQSPKRPASRQLPNPMAQSGPGESRLSNEAYLSHDAKRRRVEPPVVSQSPMQTVPRVASPAYSQVRGQPAVQDSQTTSQYNYPSHSNASQTPPMSQATTQPTVQHITQDIQRLGSQYAAPAQARSMPQTTQRTASPATSQALTQRVSQYTPQAQPKAPARAPASASPQTTAQQIPRRTSQYNSPNVTSQAVPHTVANSATQFQAQHNHSHPNSHCVSPQPTPQDLPQTVALSDTQIRPPQYNYARPKISPQSKPQALPQQPEQSPSQSTTQSTTLGTKQQPKPAPKPATQSAAKSATKSATPPVPQNKTPSLPPQCPPSAQQGASAPGSFKPPQAPSQPASAPHCQFATYSFKPENPADRTYLKRRMDLVSQLKGTDAAKKLTYDPNTIARDILITAGRHPTESTLNHHLFRLRDVFSAVDMNSDLGTFRWDLVDPGQPSRDIKARVASQKPPMQTTQTPPQPAVHVQPPPPVNNNSNTRPPPTFQQVQLPPPPQQPKPQPQKKPQSQPKPQFQVQLQSQPQPAPAPSPASRSQPAPGTPNSMEKKRRGRPPGSTNKPKVPAAATAAAPAASASSFPVFACRWGNCQAELHNLDLLKKHLFKIHVSRQLTCGWKGCTFTGTLPATELMNHVKKDHLDSVAFKLGDGPSVPKSVDRDSISKAVPLTVPETGQPGNEDPLIFPADYGSIRAFNKVHGNNSHQDKAREIFKAVQRLKEHIGVGLDPGGCELATPVRNERVSTEEDVYEVQSGP